MHLPCMEQKWISGIIPRFCYLKLIISKGYSKVQSTPFELSPPHCCLSKDAGESERCASWFKIMPDHERQKIITSWKKKKKAFIYRKWLEVTYAGPMVRCWQPPNLPCDLWFHWERVLNRNNLHPLIMAENGWSQSSVYLWRRQRR